MSLRNAVFSATLVEYLQSGALLSLPAVAETLGSKWGRSHREPQLKSSSVRQEWHDRVVLSVEDYLHGVITLVNELVSSTIT